MRYAMAIDTRKCVGCSDCVVACQTENDVPRGYCRDWIVTELHGEFPQLTMEIRSERCNHCDRAPCVDCCPTGASHVEELGKTVQVTAGKCIGCKACIAACPYGARYVHPEGYVDKCTFCAHRVKDGLDPACVSVCPTLFGEKIVMRLLDKSNLQLDMTKLGFDAEPLKWFKEAIDRPYGMVLVTGPTGSGKTTTLYSALAALNDPTTNVCTAEDPVEFNFAGINQVQMQDSIGLNFAAALRSFLRQDPDTIMIGEIRDFETAEIGVKAALTGHLVLSTLHTNDAPGTVSRLLNMGIEPFMVTASLNLILAQRLMRRLCNACKKPVQNVDEQALIDAGIAADKIGSFTLYEKAGCKECNDRGYRGRVAVYEVMPFWDPLKEIVINGASAAELKQEAVRLGMQTLRMAALGKVMGGHSTIEEAVSNTAPDRF